MKNTSFREMRNEVFFDNSKQLLCIYKTAFWTFFRSVKNPKFVCIFKVGLLGGDPLIPLSVRTKYRPIKRPIGKLESGAICQKTEVKLTPQNWGVKISKKGKKNILLIYAPL